MSRLLRRQGCCTGGVEVSRAATGRHGLGREIAPSCTEKTVLEVSVSAEGVRLTNGV